MKRKVPHDTTAGELRPGDRFQYTTPASSAYLACGTMRTTVDTITGVVLDNAHDGRHTVVTYANDAEHESFAQHGGKRWAAHRLHLAPGAPVRWLSTRKVVA